MITAAMTPAPLAADEAALLLAIEESPTPLGSRKAADALREAGIDVSESTVSRLLRRLDEQGLTRALESKGRVLTDVGRREVQRLAERDRREGILTEATDVQSLKELLDLLRARRGVEREAARAAARNAGPKDVRALEKLVHEHKHRLETGETVRHGALTFHQLIGDMADNRLIGAMMDVLFGPTMDRVEAVLDVIIGSHHSEERSVAEHIEIIEAIVAGEPERADAAMAAHLSRLIEEAESFAATEHGGLVDRLLVWAREEASDPDPTTDHR
jgi:GntR family L-lactate dehydrogenase operon transcriptional regulator